MQFAVYISDIPVTLKQSQGHQSYNDNVDPKQGYNHAKFERFCVNGVQENAIVKAFFTRGNMSLTSFEHAQKSEQWYTHDLLEVINNCTKFQLN